MKIAYADIFIGKSIRRLCVQSQIFHIPGRDTFVPGYKFTEMFSVKHLGNVANEILVLVYHVQPHTKKGLA